MDEAGKIRLSVQIKYKDRNGSGRSLIQNLRSDAPDEDLYYAGITVLRLLDTAGLKDFSVHKTADRQIG